MDVNTVSHSLTHTARDEYKGDRSFGEVQPKQHIDVAAMIRSCLLPFFLLLPFGTERDAWDILVNRVAGRRPRRPEAKETVRSCMEQSKAA